MMDSTLADLGGKHRAKDAVMGLARNGWLRLFSKSDVFERGANGSAPRIIGGQS
jgi:hypothetical protein